MTALIVLKTGRAYLPLLLGAVAFVGGLLAFILAILLDAFLLLVGGGRGARVDAVATALLALAALATAVVVGGLVGRLLQVIGMVVPVSAELSFAFVLRKREVFFDCFVKVLAGKGDGHEGEDQHEGQLHSSIRSTFGSSVYIDSMVGMLLGSICFACVLQFMAGRCFASLTPAAPQGWLESCVAASRSERFLRMLRSGGRCEPKGDPPPPPKTISQQLHGWRRPAHSSAGRSVGAYLYTY